MKKLFDNKASRAQYFLASVVAGLFLVGIEYIKIDSNSNIFYLIFYCIYVIAYFMSLVYLMLVTVWRLNDLHKSRWLIFLLWIPLVNLFIALQLLFSEGGNKTSLKQDIKKQMSTDKKSLLIILIGLPLGLILLAIFVSIFL